MENDYIKGLITEKFIISICAGCIPIYLGDPEITKIFNPKRFIHIRDYMNFEDCIDYVLKVDSDPSLYNSIIMEPVFQPYINKKELLSFLYGGKFYEELYIKFPVLSQYIKIHLFFPINIHFLTFADTKLYTY